MVGGLKDLRVYVVGNFRPHATLNTFKETGERKVYRSRIRRFWDGQCKRIGTKTVPCLRRGNVGGFNTDMFGRVHSH